MSLHLFNNKILKILLKFEILKIQCKQQHELNKTLFISFIQSFFRFLSLLGLVEDQQHICVDQLYGLPHGAFHSL